jgi:hypothetical protein
MDEIDGIWSCHGLKYGTYKIFDTFLFINIDGDQNIGQKRTPLKTRVHILIFPPFLFDVYEFGCFL